MWGQDKQESKNTVEGEIEDGSELPNPVKEEADDVSAFVGKGVEFKGTISYSGTVRIDGFLNGEIHTDGVLLIGDEAVARLEALPREERLALLPAAQEHILAQGSCLHT